MIVASTPALRVQIFADGANLESMLVLADDPLIKGFTTNPTLMRQSGVKDYATFARTVLKAIPDKPISFEVLADTPAEIRRQAQTIADWGGNVYVKVPITTSEGEPLTDVIHDLAHKGVQVNVTAVFTLDQVWTACQALKGGAASVVSAFIGAVSTCLTGPVNAIISATGERRTQYTAGVMVGLYAMLFGLVAPLVTRLMLSTPPAFIATLAGLAMLRVLQSAFTVAFQSRFALGALVTFLVTVAGIPILNIGAPFWALIAGSLVSLVLERGDWREAGPARSPS